MRPFFVNIGFVFTILCVRSSCTKMKFLHTIACVCILVLLSVASVSAQKSTDALRARDAYINGTTLQLQGNKHAEAILEFQQSLRYDTTAATMVAIAKSYLELRKVSLAKEYILDALRLDSAYTEAIELLAEILVYSGQYDEAIQEYEKIRVLKPTERQLYTLGRLYEPRDAQKAILVFEELVAKTNDVAVLRRLVDLYGRRKDYNGRLSAVMRATRIDSLDPDIASDAVSIAMKGGDFDTIQVILNRWHVSAASEEYKVRVWGSAMESMLNDSLFVYVHAKEIRGLFETVYTHYSKIWPLTSVSGAVAMVMSDTVWADKLFTLALQSPTVTSDCILQIGASYLTAHKPFLAQKVLQQGFAKAPNDARFPYLLAAVENQLERSKQARKLYAQAIQLDASYVDALLQLAMSYEQDDISDSSQLIYNRVLYLDPDNALACNNLAYSLAVQNKDLERARDLSWTSIQQSPNTPSYLDTYAWILYRLGDLDRAKMYIDRAILYGGNATHYEHLGDILFAQGDTTGAVSAWKKSLERDPDRSSVLQKLARTY